MLYWIGRACREQRVAKGRTQGNVAASLGVDSATVGRFERGERWSRDPDAMVGAYADDLDITPIALWALAIERWQEHLSYE